MEDIGVRIYPKVDRKSFTELKAYFKTLEKQLRVVVPIEFRVDRESLARARAMQSTLGGDSTSTQTAETKVKTSMDKQSMNRTALDHRRFMRGLGLSSLISVGVVGATSATSNVASLTASFASLLGVAGLAPAALGAVTAAGVTMGAAFKGVGTALTAISDKKDPTKAKATEDPRIEAMKFEDAQQAIADAQDNAARSQADALKNIARAQRNRDDAVEASIDAQKRLNDAVKEARKDLRDLELQSASAAVKQRQAAEELQNAEDAYTLARFDPGKLSSSVESAKTARDAASVALQEQTASADDLAKKSAEANLKGVEGADKVVTATRGVRDANRDLMDSQQALKDSYADYARQAKESQQAVSQAQRSLLRLEIERADAADKADQAVRAAMSNISPAAATAVIALSAVSDQLHDIRLAGQEDYFKGFGSSLTSMSNTLFPQLKAGVKDIAGSLGQGTQQLFGGLEKSLGGGALGTMLSNFATTFANLNGAIQPIVNSFTNLTVVGSSFLPQLATGFADLAGRFDGFISKVTADGSLARWIQGGLDAAKQLGGILEGAFGILGAIGKAGSAAGGATLQTFGDGLKRISDIMNKEPFQTSMRVIFEAANKAMENMGGALKPIGDMFVALAPTLKKVLPLLGSIVGEGLSGIAKMLSNPVFQQGLKDMFGGLLKMMDGLQPAMGPLGQLMGNIGTFIGHLAEKLGPVIAIIIEQLVPVFGVLLDASLPLIDSLASMLTTVLPALMPLVQAAAGIIMALMGEVKFLSDGLAMLFDPEFWKRTGGMFSDFWNNTGGMIKDFCKNTVGMIEDFVGNTIGMFVDFFTNADKGLADWRKSFGDGFQGMIGDIGKWFADLPKVIGDFFNGAGDWLFNSGKNIVEGLIKGVQSMAGELGRFFQSILPGWMTDPFKKGIDSHSPSRVFAKLGAYIPQGVMVGVESEQANLDAQMRGLISVPTIPTSTARTSSDAAGAAPMGRGQQFRDLIIQKADDPEAAATVITRKLARSF